MDRVTTRRPPAHSEAPVGQTPEAAASNAGYVNWLYLGAESVFFYPPGSEKEHLVVDHGIPSVDMHWQVKGKLYDHAGDHCKQRMAALGAIGDLVAVTHAHGLTERGQLQLRAVTAAGRPTSHWLPGVSMDTALASPELQAAVADEPN